MGYTEMTKQGVYVPNVTAVSSDFGRNALRFIRNCEKLKFTTEEGKKGHDNVPYNFERDVDRLAFENAIGRFLKTGTREDAFDVYFCYSEIFKPFGAGYESTKVILEMLSEHEENSSTLLMKHRDHYSHAVYVFLIGLSIYHANEGFRKAYAQKYNDKLAENQSIDEHFLEYWGMTSLFHDIGYPFEIAHQQMKAYVYMLTNVDIRDENSIDSFEPFVAYKDIDKYATVKVDDQDPIDIIKLMASAIEERFSNNYLTASKENLEVILRDRAVYEVEIEKDNKKEYLTNRKYLDHAFFSGLLLIKKYLLSNKGRKPSDSIMDAFCAIILHNSLFKMSIRKKGGRPLELTDGQPLAYLLMLCDELQCWDRSSFGKNSRRGIYPFDFDIRFENVDGVDGDELVFIYYFDQVNAKLLDKKGENAKQYKEMQPESGTAGRCAFLEDIDEIISFGNRIKTELHTAVVPRKKKTRKYLSESNYLNLYDFALALNARYERIIDPVEVIELSADRRKEFKSVMSQMFDDLSLEFKLSNIAQAKGFAKNLDEIGCFYTDRAVDYEEVTSFTDDEYAKLARSEHERWYDEKAEMGWVYGNDYEGDRAKRAILRHHKDMVDFSVLDKETIEKDRAPMEMMIKLLNLYEGNRIYRL